MIEIENLTVRFGGVRGLNELTATLDVPITALVGPNGAGKTTLLNVLSGFVHPTTGKVRVDGQEILRLAPYRRAGFGIRRTFQTEQVVENLSVWDHAAAILDNVPYGGRSRDELIRAALDFVGLTPQADALGRELTAHDRRMVEIARAVAGVPRLIMMDEPGAGLSESESEHLRQVILGIPAFCGAQVLLVDHDVDLVSATCAATLVLDFGSKIAYGPTQQVLNDPAVRAAYLGTTEGEAA
jgi:ABC-type branched-subunit amino acid transport system ATPase component